MKIEPISLPSSGQDHRFHLLDGLRGIAALFVLIFHAASELPFHFPNAFLAVDFFFCLSGFVIAYSYGKRLSKDLTLKSFLGLRLIRLFPLYLLGTFLVVLRSPQNHDRMQYLHTNPLGFAVLLLLALCAVPNFFFSGLEGNLYPFNIPAWSLFYECTANMGYAILIKKRLVRVVLPLAGGLSFFFLGLLAFHHAIPANSGSPFLPGGMRSGYATALARSIFSFSVGAAIFHCYSRHQRTYQPSGMASLIAVAALSLGLGLSIQEVRTPIFQFLFITVVSPLIVYFSALVIVPRKFVWICVLLGDISYPVYMLHTAFRIPSSQRLLLLAHDHSGVFISLFLVVMAITVGFSWLANKFYDLPIRKWLTARWKQQVSIHSLHTPQGAWENKEKFNG